MFSQLVGRGTTVVFIIVQHFFCPDVFGWDHSLSSWDRRPTGFPCDGSAGERENRDTQSMFTLGYGSVWHLRVILNKHTGRSLSLALRTIPLVYLNPGKAEALNTCSDDPNSFRPKAWPNVAETY